MVAPAILAAGVAASRSSAPRSWEGRPAEPRAEAVLPAHPEVSVRAHSKHTVTRMQREPVMEMYKSRRQQRGNTQTNNTEKPELKSGLLT